MSKKSGFAKFLVGTAAIAVTGKVAYDKYKIMKEKFEKEENESIADEVKKYNAVCTTKTIEIEDEEFTGCEIKAVASKLLIDLSLAEFCKDVYINFKSDASMVKIVLPEGVNAVSDIENVASNIKNLVENVEEDGIHTVFVIGKSLFSNIEIIPANFYADEEDFEDEDFADDDESDFPESSDSEAATAPESDVDILEVVDDEEEAADMNEGTDTENMK